MNKRLYYIALLFWGVLFTLTMPVQIMADQDWDDSANNNPPNYGLSTVQVELKHRVIIPAIIYFRVGSAEFGTIDQVKFDLINSPGFNQGTNTYSGGNPLGDGTAVNAAENGTLVVDLRSNVGTVTIGCQVSDSNGLSDGNSRFIAFDEIDTQSDDATNLPAPVLANDPSGNTVTITGNLYNGRVVNRQANWTYTYKNTTTPVAGTYNGQVTYTASAP